MSTKPGKDANPTDSTAKAPSDDEEREGGLLPAILAGAGILAVVGLLVFWPSGDDDAADGRAKSAQNDSKNGRGSAANANDKGGRGAQGGGGVGARSADEATPAASARGRTNSRFSPKGLGMAPAVPVDEGPPKFKNVEDEISWYEGRLDSANSQLETRHKNIKRLPKMKQNAEESANPSAALAKYESSKKTVEANLARAEAKVAKIEEKLAELRAQ